MKKYFWMLILTLFISGCCKEYADLIPGQDFIPEEILQAIKDNGQTIYTGYNPPALSGRYSFQPQTLVNSNFNDNLSVGYQFVDAEIEFSDFNSETLQLKVRVKEIGLNEGEGYGSFISGQGNNFTVYVKIEATDIYGHTVLQTEVLSGTLEATGIRNLQRSLFMVDDKGDPNNSYIENGQGRLIEDGDGFSEKI